MFRFMMLAAALVFSSSAAAGPGPCPDPVVDASSAWSHVQCMFDYLSPIVARNADDVLGLNSTVVFLSTEIDALWVAIDDLAADDGTPDLIEWSECGLEPYPLTSGEESSVFCIDVTNVSSEHVQFETMHLPVTCSDWVGYTVRLIDDLGHEEMNGAQEIYACNPINFVDGFYVAPGVTRRLMVMMDVPVEDVGKSVALEFDARHGFTAKVMMHQIDPDEVRTEGLGYEFEGPTYIVE